MSSRFTTRTLALLLGLLITVSLVYFSQEPRKAIANENKEHSNVRKLTGSEINTGEKPANQSAIISAKRLGLGTPDKDQRHIPEPIPANVPAPLSPRRVWLEQTEWMATRMLGDDLAFEDAAETLSNLIDACDSDDLEWKLIDGISTCSIMQSDDLGEAVVRAIPQSPEGSSGFQVELSFVDPPGAWSPGEARSSSLFFDLQLDEDGTPTYCSAFLNSNFRQASEGGPAANSTPLRSGAIIRLSNGQRSIQFLTTHVDASGNRTYKLQDPEATRDEDLSSPGTTRLVQTLRGLRRHN